MSLATHMRAAGALRVLRRAGPELAAFAIAVLAGLLMSRWLRGGFPLDDAWIHMVYGLSFARDGTLSYNLGHPATGATSPLWALLLGVVHLLVGAQDPATRAVVAVKALGLALHGTSALLAALLARRMVVFRGLQVPAAVAAGLLVATTPILAYSAISGMEGPLAGVLLLATFLALHARRRIHGSLLLGLAVLARPEAIVALPPALLLAWFADSGRERMRTLAATALPAMAAPLLLAARNYTASGRWLPATWYGKANLGRPFEEALWRAFVDTLGGLHPTSFPPTWILAGAALCLGAIALRRLWRGIAGPLVSGHLVMLAGALTALGWLAGAALVVNIQLPEEFYYQRYLLPPLPLLMVVACAAGAHLYRAAALRHRTLARAAALFVASGAALWAAASFVPCRETLARDIAAIDSAQVAIGRYIAEKLPQKSVVWTVDAGAVRYLGQRRTVDLMGLNTPELVRRGRVPRAWWPDALVIVPRVFRVHAPPGLLQPLLLARHAGDPLPPERSLDAKLLIGCTRSWETDPSNQVAVFAGKHLLAAAGCMRRTDK